MFNLSAAHSIQTINRFTELRRCHHSSRLFSSYALQIQRNRARVSNRLQAGRQIPTLRCISSFNFQHVNVPSASLRSNANCLTAAAARQYGSTVFDLETKTTRRSRSPRKSTNKPDIAKLTRQLLSDPIRNNSTSDVFKASLAKTRANKPFLKSLGLTPSEAQSMLIMPPDLLKDVHLAVSHFSKREYFQGITLNDNTHTPGPILCARLLELIGIPYYSNTADSPISIHSSQIDDILHCCLQTTLALSNGCKPTKDSLIHTNFNFSGNNNLPQPGGIKTPAHFSEEIWKFVSNIQIRFTTQQVPTMQMPNLLSRINASCSNMNDPFTQYFNGSGASFSWGKKDQRRYKQAISLFNATLAAYARLGSSTSGMQHEVRRDMVQTVERLLVEQSGNQNRDSKPTPATLLQSVRPDVISFNTAMNAWSQMNPRLKGDESDGALSTLTAERTQAILEMMQELWDEERSTQTTREAWEEFGGELYQTHAVFPNTSSYNTALNAWARSSSCESIDRAMDLFGMMVDRCNLSCYGRAMLMQNESKVRDGKGVSLEGAHAFPDSRTFVSLFGCIANRSSNTKSFDETVGLIENIFDTMKHWDEQLQWSRQHNLSPDGQSTPHEPLLNVFAYNALIKALSSIHKSSWEESLQCCKRIEEIISQHMTITAPDAITRGIAVHAWSRCVEYAGHDLSKKEFCVNKAFAHLELMLLPELITPHGSVGGNSYLRSRAVHYLNDFIALCGKNSMPAKANEAFLLAKERNFYNLTALSQVVHALTKSKDLSHINKALQHLLDMERGMTHRNSLNNSIGKQDLYNACIAGFINANDDLGCDKAHKLLMHMIDTHSRNPLYIGRPNNASFTLVMDALAKRGKSSQVEALLAAMEESKQQRRSAFGHALESDFEVDVGPDITHYNALMTSYSNNSNAALAKALFDRMKNSPDIPSPNGITKSLILRLQDKFEHEMSLPEQTLYKRHAASFDEVNLDDLILDTIKQTQNPTIASFNPVLKTIAKAGTIEGAERCSALLRRMEEMYAAGDISIRPDIISYNLVLNAWQFCEQNNVETASISPSEKAEEILDSLCYNLEQENDLLKPNNASFSICIHAWCKSSQSDAAERAEMMLRRKEKFLNRVEDSVIHTTDYNAIISKWKDDPDNGTERARMLFDDIVQKAEESDAYEPPNGFSFNSLLAVYAKSNENGAEKAEELLRQLYLEEKSNIRPDMISYRTCINAWIDRKDSVAPQKVEALVQDLIEKYKSGWEDLRPDSNLFDLILKACTLAPISWDSNAEEKANNQIIEIANRTFTLLRGKNEFKARPTHSTYAFMLRIFNRHLDFNDQRYDLLMKNLWEQCCRDGLVSEFTLESLRKSVTESNFFHFIGIGRGRNDADSIKVSSLRSDWRRNVVPKRKSNKGKIVSG